MTEEQQGLSSSQITPENVPAKKERKIKRWNLFSLAIIWFVILPFSLVPATFSLMAFDAGSPGVLATIGVLLITTSPIFILIFAITDIRFSFKPKIDSLGRWRTIFLYLQVIILVGAAYFTFLGFQGPTEDIFTCKNSYRDYIIDSHGKRIDCPENIRKN